MFSDGLKRLAMSLSPHEFLEEKYVNSPPIIFLEVPEGRELLLVAATKDSGPLNLLETLSVKGFLRKVVDGVYRAEKPQTIDAFEKFLWLMRLSWRDRETYYSWCILNAYSKASDYESLSSILRTEYSTQLEEALKALDASPPPDYDMLPEIVLRRLSQALSRIPTTLSRKIVDYLCTYGESTVEELAIRVVRGGVNASSVYRTISRLKKENYVKVLRHVRFSERGPMRELLASNCARCIYNYSSHVNCYKSSLNHLSAILTAFYGISLPKEALEKLYIEFRSIPFPQRVIKRVNDALLSLHSVRVKLEDKLILSILSKVQELSGGELPGGKILVIGGGGARA